MAHQTINVAYPQYGLTPRIEEVDMGTDAAVTRGALCLFQTHTPEFPDLPLPRVEVGGRLTQFLLIW